MRDDLRALRDKAAGKVLTLDELEAPSTSAREFSFSALRGRFIELSGNGASAVLSAAVELVAQAQRAREPAAWIASREGSFYPPDVAACGVDLDALVVVRVAQLAGAVRAAEQLLRSGAFGIAVIDLCSPQRILAPHEAPKRDVLELAAQGRLVGLAQRHHCLAVCLSDKSRERESMGSLVSLRAEAVRERRGDELVVEVRVLKDKRNGPGWSQARRAVPPAGVT